MLSIDEAIELLRTERMCVRHADVCDRECEKCALVQDTDELLEMYDSVCDWLEELKALRLLLDWAIECDFGLDSFPEEYEKYKHTLTDDMTYKDMIIQIAKCVVEEEIKEQNR